MELEIILPETVPAMTLPNIAFFPQALLPLHIFEPRYREMLQDSLATNRLFAVAGIKETLADQSEHFEPPHRVATVGMIRACQKNQDGTSNLLLQGLCRVEFVEILAEAPYRSVRVRALASLPISNPVSAMKLREELARLIALKRSLGANVPAEMAIFLRNISDLETFVDLAAYNLCENPALKQKLLETLDIQRRLELLGAQLRRDVEILRLQRKLQGPLADDGISAN